MILRTHKKYFMYLCRRLVENNEVVRGITAEPNP